MTIKNKINELKAKQVQRLSFLDDLSPQKIDAHIDNLFPSFNVAQKTFMKKLSNLLILHLEKKIRR